MNASRPLQILATLAILSASTAVSAGPLRICAELEQRSKMMTVKIDNGCVTSKFRKLPPTIDVSVDQDSALINVTGGFHYVPHEGGSVSKDCMGRQRFEITISNIEPRRYSISNDTGYLGAIDFVDGETRACVRQDRRAKHAASLVGTFPSKFADDASFDDALRADTVLGLMDSFLGGFPEPGEGQPEMTLKLESIEVDGTSLTMKVEATLFGLQDDSISGLKYLTFVEHGHDGWRIVRSMRQQMCGRGPRAGQWTKAPCD